MASSATAAAAPSDFGASATLKRIHQNADRLKNSMEESPSGLSSLLSELEEKRRLVSTGKIQYKELQQLFEETSNRLATLASNHAELAQTATNRQESFLRSEEKYKEDLRTLEVRLAKLGVEDQQRMDPLRQMHVSIQSTIASIQDKTSQVLQDQERDLIRAFRARLADVTVELENERKKNESGSAEWVARCRKLTEELEWLRDLTDKLTAENKNVLKENRRCKRQMKTQEEDREFLIKQLVSVKKENARLRFSFDQLMAGNIAAININPAQQQQQNANMPVLGSLLQKNNPGGSRSNSRPTSSTQPSRSNSQAAMYSGGGGGQSLSPSSSATHTTAAATHELEERYKRLLQKAQKQTEEMTAKYRALRTSYTQEMAQKTELQNFLKKCIDDVRADIAERGRSATLRRVAGAASASSSSSTAARPGGRPVLDPRLVPLSEFTAQDRVNVMEWLLAQDQVIFLLFDLMFPSHAQPQQLQPQLQQQQPHSLTSTGKFAQLSSPLFPPTTASGLRPTTSTAASQSRPGTSGWSGARPGGSSSGSGSNSASHSHASSTASLTQPTHPSRPTSSTSSASTSTSTHSSSHPHSTSNLRKNEYQPPPLTGLLPPGAAIHTSTLPSASLSASSTQQAAARPSSGSGGGVSLVNRDDILRSLPSAQKRAYNDEDDDDDEAAYAHEQSQERDGYEHQQQHHQHQQQQEEEEEEEEPHGADDGFQDVGYEDEEKTPLHL